MAKKFVKLDSRLHITSFGNDMEFNVRFDAEPNNIFIRSTIGNEDMRQLAEWLKRNSEHGYNVSEKIQQRVINWVMEKMPDTTYHVVIDFMSPNGNLQRYYLMGVYGEVIKYGGSAMKKLYTNRRSAINAAKRVKEEYKSAHVMVFEHQTNGGLETIISEFL